MAATCDEGAEGESEAAVGRVVAAAMRKVVVVGAAMAGRRLVWACQTHRSRNPGIRQEKKKKEKGRRSVG